MSKAFVKERYARISGGLPDREMLPHANLATVEGVGSDRCQRGKFGSRVMVERDVAERDVSHRRYGQSGPQVGLSTICQAMTS